MRVYDLETPFDHDIIQSCLENSVLSPNSSNLQLWEFYRIISPEAKKKMTTFCLNQPAAATSREMVVFVSRPDKWKDRQKEIVSQLEKQFPTLTKAERAKNGAFKYYEQIIPMLYSRRLGSLSDFVKKIIVNFRGMKKPTPREVTHTDIRISAHRSISLAAQTFMLAVKAAGYDSCPMEGHDSSRIKKFLNLPKEAEINMVISVGLGKPQGIYGPRFRVDNKKVIFVK